MAPNLKLLFLKRFNGNNAILENIFLIELSDSPGCSLLVRSSMYSNVIDYYVQRILRFNLNLKLDLLRACEGYDSLFKADLIVHYF